MLCISTTTDHHIAVAGYSFPVPVEGIHLLIGGTLRLHFQFDAISHRWSVGFQACTLRYPWGVRADTFRYPASETWELSVSIDCPDGTPVSWKHPDADLWHLLQGSPMAAIPHPTNKTP